MTRGREVEGSGSGGYGEVVSIDCQGDEYQYDALPASEFAVCPEEDQDDEGQD